MMKSALDYMLERFGRQITLRQERPTQVDVVVYAKLRPLKPYEAIGGLTYDYIHVVCQVPDPTVWTPVTIKKGVKVIAANLMYTVDMVYPMYESSELVGYRMYARG